MPRKPDEPASQLDRLRAPRELPFAMPESCGRLPHLLKEGCTYFVTFCLLDAGRRRAALRLAPTDDDVDAIAETSEPKAATRASSLLRRDVADEVCRALRHFDQQRYFLHAYCVMPDHVHVVVTPFPGYRLLQIVSSWKAFSARRVNPLLCRRGPLWQRECFDHAIRSVEHFDRFVRYVERNPVAAGLCDAPDQWPHSSAARHTSG